MKVQNNFGNGIFFFFIALLMSFLFYRYYSKYTEEKAVSQSLSESITNLSDSAKIYKVKFEDGKKRSVAQISALSMKTDNIKALYDEKVKEMKRLGIKVKSVKSVTSAATVTRDSAVYIPIFVDSLKQLYSEYDDGYLKMRNTIYRDYTSRLDYQYRDSFDLINNVRQKHFLFFKWKKKTSVYYLVPRNPKTNVLYLKVIERVE